MAPGVAIVVGLTTMFYFPALLLGKTLAHGDIALIDVPFFGFLPRVFRGEVSGLWVHGLYGGHPLFAESQAGLANPLNIIWALLVTPTVGPVYSMHLFRWFIEIAAAIGVIGLCRSLGARAWSATFAALAVIFSPIWLHQNTALPVIHSLCWSVWVLWAMECLLKRPSPSSAIAFGAAGAALLFAGYPQVLHGTILFALATVAVAPLQAAARLEWAAAWKRRATFGTLALAIGVGLVAVQIFPLLELKGYSHRSEGIGIAFSGMTPFLSYAKGFLFTQSKANASYWHSAGSVLVFALAVMCVLVPAPARAKSYIAGAALLTVLGMEYATPLFSVIHTLHLIPGLNYFRAMHVYLATATLGIAVVAAFGLDGIASRMSRQAWWPSHPWRAAAKAARILAYLLASGLVGWSVGAPRPASNVALQCAILLLCVAVALDLCKRQRADLLAPFAVTLLVAEILLLRMHPFGFWPSTIFSKPPTVAAIQSVPHWREYRVMDVTLARLMVFVPNKREIPNRVYQLMSLLTPMTSLYWDIPSMDAHLGLPLRRRMAIHEPIREEIRGSSGSRPPGLRYIDFLGVRFIGSGGPLSTPGFRVLAKDDRPVSPIGGMIMENEAALPRFQVYTSYRIVGSLDSALAAMRELREPSLVVEVPDPKRLNGLPQALDGDGPAQAQAAKVEVLSAADTLYRLKVDARQPVWLFVADANYPGWEATIDDVSVPVFSAQVLGKAILVPSGTHTVVFRFRSWSFQIGLAISLTTLLVTAVLLGWDLQRRRRDRLHGFA